MPLRLALVGCGAVAEWHWKAIAAAATRTRVTACIDPDPARAAAMAEKTGGAPYPTLAEALAEDVADAVAILVPHHLHEELALQALRAFKHVRLEKPMTTSVEGCARILHAARAAGTVFMLAENAQYWPGVVRAKALLDDGAIGELVTARAWCSTPMMPQFHDGDALDRAPLAASAEYGVGELRGALAMYRSAESGRWEPVW